MVADSIIYHPTYVKLLKFLDASPKREKCFRLVAYLSRFLSYYLYKTGYSKQLVDTFKTVKTQVTFLRKGMRFLKPLHHLETASKTFDNKLMDPILQKTTVIRNLGYAGYLSIDAFIFLKMVGLVDKKRWPKGATWASRFWLLGLVAGVINSLRSIQINTKKLQSAAKTEEKVDVDDISGKLYKSRRKLVWDFLDMFIALNSLDYLHFTEGDVGLAGTITSIMGLRDLWAAT